MTATQAAPSLSGLFSRIFGTTETAVSDVDLADFEVLSTRQAPVSAPAEVTTYRTVTLKGTYSCECGTYNVTFTREVPENSPLQDGNVVNDFDIDSDHVIDFNG